MLGIIRRFANPVELRLEDDLYTVCHKLGLSAAATLLEISNKAASLYGYDSSEYSIVSSVIRRYHQAALHAA